MKKAPLTIVVPVRNRAQYIVRTLDSIAVSSCAFAELIVVDNGSEDNTMTVCQQWMAAHPYLPVRILTEPRLGAAVARNCGLRACRSEYIYFFDSDDIFSADFVESILPSLIAEVDVLCVPVCQEVKGSVTTRPYRNCADVHVHLLNNMLSTQSMVYRMDFLMQMGGWNETLTTWDDWELGVRVLLSHPRLHWLEGKAFHRMIVHDDSLTGASFSITLPAITKAMHTVRQTLEQAEMTDKERLMAARAFYLRCMIYGGLLRGEGNHEGEVIFRTLAEERMKDSKISRLTKGHLLRWAGSLLRRYTAVGGRGAWRLALFIAEH